MTEYIMPIRYVSMEEEFKRNPELKMSDLQMLKDWMDKQPHLPDIPILYLIIFLHSNYYHIEPTKSTIENFFTVRWRMPEVFYNRDPVAWKELRKAFTVVALILLQQRTKENYIMIFGKLLDTNPSRYNYVETLKYLFMTCEVQNITEGTSSGQVIVFDATGFSLGHVGRMNLMLLKKILFFVQEEGAPVRLKVIHVLNAIPAAETLLNMLKPFMKANLLNIVHFHANIKSAEEFLPIEALPNEMGGKAGPLKDLVDMNIKLLEEFRPWFLQDERILRVNESLRVGKFQAADDLFGVDGSFKKLEID
ncbi:PREDICTED: alpha-tocopherol transfer protein-like isoform X2 [Dinoponera quadriceps]|nr:PREDICTED: alpha-tocopherol transfer protein-like isoform X2 [Dinoponera quadriceps]XP_014474000.1 PREDICTED: alpha-tocopherol transfer protein-like isoform X2 [Dinoponera quadriceps]